MAQAEENGDIYSSNLKDLDHLSELQDGDLPPVKGIKKKEISKFNSSIRSQSKDVEVPEINKKDDQEDNRSVNSDKELKKEVNEPERKVKSLNKPDNQSKLHQTINILSEGMSQTSSVYRGQFKFLEEEKNKRQLFKEEFSKLDPEIQEKLIKRMQGIMADRSFMRYKMTKDLSTNGGHSSFQKSLFGSTIKNKKFVN